MERKVGEIFTYNGKTYQVVKADTCKDCAFSNIGCNSFQTLVAGTCIPEGRKDNINVAFREINNMENNQLTINIPEGMEIDLENSKLAKGIVKFKKKDITYKLKPFDKVVVRCGKADKWSIDFFSYKVSNGYICTGDAWFGYCLPYNEETAKLVGTTNNIED